MKATINGTTYDTARSEEICNYPSPDGDDHLYRTRGGKFFIEEMSCFVDGVKLRPDQSPEDLAPELDLAANWDETVKVIHRRKLPRVRYTRRIVPITERKALVWCVKTQMPDCFREYVLDSI